MRSSKLLRFVWPTVCEASSRSASSRGYHHPLAAEVGDVLFRNAEIIRQQMAWRLRQPVRQGALVVGAAIQHADHLGILRTDVLDRVSAIAGDVGALARREFGP